MQSKATGNGLIILGTTTLAVRENLSPHSQDDFKQEFCGHKYCSISEFEGEEAKSSRAENMTPCWSAYGGKTRSAFDHTSSNELSKEVGLSSVSNYNPTSQTSTDNAADLWSLILRLSSWYLSSLRSIFTGN